MMFQKPQGYKHQHCAIACNFIVERQYMRIVDTTILVSTVMQTSLVSDKF